MRSLAIIAGSGLTTLPGWTIKHEHTIHTPYGAPSNSILEGNHQKRKLFFLPRHGMPHRFLPHEINYRANLWALGQLGVEEIIAVNTVGGICPAMAPRTLLLPDQIIDYTYGREQVFEKEAGILQHMDFSFPYSANLRQRLIEAGAASGVALMRNGTYGATQGPRLETAAEIQRLCRDGCDVVGMTGMPEAALARALQIDYASCCLVVNWAAGITKKPLVLTEIEQETKANQKQFFILLKRFLAADTEN